MLRRIGLLTIAALLAAGIGAKPMHAQDSKKATATEEADKKKAEKKNAPKQAGADQTNAGSGKSAPMSGFRPDPQSSY